MNYLKGLAQDAGFHWEPRSFNRNELLTADEVFRRVHPGAFPAVQIDGNPIGKGIPGPVFHELLNAWSKTAGLDLAEQSRKGAIGQNER